MPAELRIDFELVGKFEVSDGQSNGIVGQFIGYVTDWILHNRNDGALELLESKFLGLSQVGENKNCFWG